MYLMTIENLVTLLYLILYVSPYSQSFVGLRAEFQAEAPAIQNVLSRTVQSLVPTKRFIITLTVSVLKSAMLSVVDDETKLD